MISILFALIICLAPLQVYLVSDMLHYTQSLGMRNGGCCAATTNVTLVSATAVSVEFVVPFRSDESLLIEVSSMSGHHSEVAVVPNGGLEYDYVYSGLNLSDTYCFRVVNGTNDPCYITPVCLNTTQQYQSGAVPVVNTFSYLRNSSNRSNVLFRWSISENGNGILSCLEATTVVPRLLFFKAVFESSPALITGFKDFTPYICYLSGQNSFGVGVNSTVTFRTRLISPTFVNVTSVGFDVIHVSWSYYSSETVSFTVRVNPLCSADKHGYDSHSAGSDTSLTVTSLKPFTLYCIEVVARSTEDGLESVPSNIVTVQTLETVPGPVRSLLVIPLSPTSLLVRWKEPEDKNGVISGYSVTIVGSFQNIVYNDTTLLQVHNLMPCREYSVQVVASTTAGTSAPTSFSVRTLDSVPKRPKVESVDRSVHLIRWKVDTPAACLEGSTVTYTPLYSIDQPFSINYTHDDPIRTEILSGELEETMAYNITISAYGPAGYGEKSQSFHLAPVVTQSSAFFVSRRTDYAQFIFIGIKNCTAWKVGVTDSDVRRALSNRLSLICPQYNELISNQWVSESTLMCMESAFKVVFQARLNVGLAFKQCMEFWYSSLSPFLVLQNQIMLLDTTCNLYINSLYDTLCFETSNSGVVGGLFGGVVLGGMLVGVGFILVLAIYYRKSICGACNRNSAVAVKPKCTSQTKHRAQNKCENDDEDGYEELPFVGVRGHNMMAESHVEGRKRSNKLQSAAAATTENVHPRLYVRECKADDTEYEFPDVVVPNKHLPSHYSVEPLSSEYDLPTVSLGNPIHSTDLEKKAASVPHKMLETVSNQSTAEKNKHDSNKRALQSNSQEEFKTTGLKVPMYPSSKQVRKDETKQLLHMNHGQLAPVESPASVCSERYPTHSSSKSEKAETMAENESSLSQAQESCIVEVSMQKASSGFKKRPLLPKLALGQEIPVAKQPKIVSHALSAQPSSEKGLAPATLPKPKNKSTRDIPLSTNCAYEQWTVTRKGDEV